MKCTIKRPVEVNVKYLIAVLPARAVESLFYEIVYQEGTIDWCGKVYSDIYSLCEDYPDIFTFKNEEIGIQLQIDIDEKKVVNWSKNCPLEFYDIKIVDEGEYTLLDDKEEVIATYQGYVPECIGEGGYGDYLEFEIDRDCNIIGFKFNTTQFENFLESTDY